MEEKASCHPLCSGSLGNLFGTKRTSVPKINRKIVNTIWNPFDLIRFCKDFSVCSYIAFVELHSGKCTFRYIIVLLVLFKLHSGKCTFRYIIVLLVLCKLHSISGTRFEFLSKFNGIWSFQFTIWLFWQFDNFIICWQHMQSMFCQLIVNVNILSMLWHWH